MRTNNRVMLGVVLALTAVVPVSVLLPVPLDPHDHPGSVKCSPGAIGGWGNTFAYDDEGRVIDEDGSGNDMGSATAIEAIKAEAQRVRTEHDRVRRDGDRVVTFREGRMVAIFVLKRLDNGRYAVSGGLPWSFIAMGVLDSISPDLLDGAVGMWCLTVGALVNALVVYLLARRQRGKRESAGLPTG